MYSNEISKGETSLTHDPYLTRDKKARLQNKIEENKNI